MIPDWWETLLLAVAAWRTFQFLAFDDAAKRIRVWAIKPVPKHQRDKVWEFLICPYCLGAWIGLAWWGSWAIWPHATIVVSVPFVISAAVIALAQMLDSG